MHADAATLLRICLLSRFNKQLNISNNKERNNKEQAPFCCWYTQIQAAAAAAAAAAGSGAAAAAAGGAAADKVKMNHLSVHPKIMLSTDSLPYQLLL